MTECVVQIWFEDEPQDASRKAFFTMVQTPYPDFETFLQAVDADRLICGTELWTRPSGKGERTITRRVPLAFRGSTVRRTALPTWKIYDAEGAE